MNEHELRRLLPAERSLSPGRVQAMERRLRDQVAARHVADTEAHAMTGTDDEAQPRLEPTRLHVRSPGPRSHRRAIVAVAAAVVVVCGATIAAQRLSTTEPPASTDAPPGDAPTDFAAPTATARPAPDTSSTPDPAEVARAQEVFDALRGPLGEGGRRWSLVAERVTCELPGPDGDAGGSASGFPLGDLMTVDHLVEFCTHGNDIARMNDGFDPTVAHVCIGGGEYPLAVVVLDGRDCAQLDTPLGPMTDAAMEDLNRRRAVEIAVLAAPQDCPTEDEARAWVDEVLAARGVDLPVEVDGTSSAPGPSTRGTAAVPAVGRCYLGRVYWDWMPEPTVRIGPQFLSPAPPD